MEAPEKLLSFTYRVGQGSPEAMGIDTSATLASIKEIGWLKSYAPRNTIEAGMISEILKNTIPYPIFKVSINLLSWFRIGDSRVVPTRVPCKLTSPELTRRGHEEIAATTNTTRYFLIGKHTSGHHSPTGRGTKGYLALELPGPGERMSRLWFLKDYWQPLHPPAHTELGTYLKLENAGVESVARAVADGDVLGRDGKEETTMTQTLLRKKKQAVLMPSERRHFRLVTSELGRPLQTYRCSDELIWALLQALHGTDIYALVSICETHRTVNL